MKSMLIIGAALVLSTGTAQASCGSAYCLLNTNWTTQGVWTEPGVRLDLRYEYIDQDQVRSGTGKATTDEIADEHHREVETINRNLIATLDYAIDDRFGVSVSAPLVDRDHTHLHVSHTDPTDIEREHWDFARLGDMRVLGRMQLSAPTNLSSAYGVMAGVKLPTGQFTVANGDGERAERSLQPGTGTTDVLLGGYYRRALPTWHSQWFAQVIAQQALASRSDFKPGQSIAADLGFRYAANAHYALMLQLNYAVRQRDRGTEAEPENSGSRTLTLSPGISVGLSQSAQFYAFVQQRLYQDVNGVQLSAPRSYVGGVSMRF